MGSRSGCPGLGVKVRVMNGGHKVGGQCQESRSGELSRSGEGGQGLAD